MTCVDVNARVSAVVVAGIFSLSLSLSHTHTHRGGGGMRMVKGKESASNDLPCTYVAALLAFWIARIQDHSLSAHTAHTLS